MKKNDYLKLKQMDRIEYLLLRNKIKFPNLNLISFLNSIIYLSFGVINIFLLLYIINIESSMVFLKRVSIIFPIIKIAIVIITAIDVLMIINYVFKIDKLNKTFLNKKQ